MIQGILEAIGIYYAMIGSIIAFMCYCVAVVFALDCVIDWVATAFIRYRKRNKDES